MAVGITISPVPIIAAILMLLSPKAKGTSVGFLIGWILGIVVGWSLSSPSRLGAAATGWTVASKPVAGVIKLVLGH